MKTMSTKTYAVRIDVPMPLVTTIHHLDETDNGLRVVEMQWGDGTVDVGMMDGETLLAQGQISAIHSSSFYLDYARKYGAEISETLDGKFMVCSPKGTEAHFSAVRKNPETAAILYLHLSGLMDLIEEEFQAKKNS